MAKIASRSSSEFSGVEEPHRRGSPVTGIVRYADVIHADMIVIGAHGRSPWERILVGSVAEGVVRAASCPVLTIKPDADQFRLV
jgi:nucleotide-binding universal stress UspA family protein